MKMNVPHKLNWSTTSTNYLKQSLFAWYVNPKKPSEQMIIFQLEADQFYVFVDDVELRLGNFRSDPRSAKHFSEKKALKIVKFFEDEKYHCVVNWWNDIYCAKYLKGIKEEDLYELALVPSGMSGWIEMCLMQPKKLKKPGNQEKVCKTVSKLLFKVSHLLTEEEIEEKPCDELIIWLQNIFKVDYEFKQHEKTLELGVFSMYFQNFRTCFYKALKENNQELFDLFINKFSIKSLDPGQDYLSYLFALDQYVENKNEYFISVMTDRMIKEGYSIQNSSLKDILFHEVKNQLQNKYPDNKYSRKILQYDFNS